ncbi:MAG TPA: STAS domain-containing protein [Planktothrix sp.]|jgi:rsbT co-antagonist protein RsbR
MTKDTLTPLAPILEKSSKALLDRWIELQLLDTNRSDSVSDASLKTNSAEFLKVFLRSAEKGNFNDMDAPEWEPVKRMLAELSANRAAQGSTPAETATFVFSLKQAVFEIINSAMGSNSGEAGTYIWSTSMLLDKLGLYTVEVHQKSREAIIRRQQKDILEMSTPVIKMWDRILAVPLIGVLDSARTQIVMENLLQAIRDNGAKIAILDITGVPTVDTQTAQHLIKTVSATRLMGAECIISGIRPQIAQTIVHLGIDIYDIATRATMEDALREALARVGYAITKE